MATNDDIRQKLDALIENHQIITNYLLTLNQYVLRSQDIPVSQNTIAALQFGAQFMKEQLQSIRAEPQTSKDEKENTLSDTQCSDIFAKFPHSSLVTPVLSTSTPLRKQKDTVVEETAASTSSLTDLYDGIAKAKGSKAYTRKFQAILRSPDLSIVSEASSSSCSLERTPLNSQPSIVSPITKRRYKLPVLTPVPSVPTRSRRAAAPSSLKEPSLRKKMRRT